MTHLACFGESIKSLWKSLDYVKNGDADPSDVQLWLSMCSNTIRELQKITSSGTLTRAQKQKCQTFMTHLLSIQNKLRDSLKTGGELRQNPSSIVSKESVKWDDMFSAFERRIKSGVITNLGHLDIVSFMKDARVVFESKIMAALKEYNALKVNAELAAEYMIQKSESVSAEVKYFNTENVPIYKVTDLKEWFKFNIEQVIQREMEEFAEKDSGWSLHQILSLTININKFEPMKGSSYIKLPNEIIARKACVNIKNEDNQCFKWSILAALHPQKHNSERLGLYKKFENELNFKGIEFPVSLKQISKFEGQNSVSVNVYILKMCNSKFKVHPCYVTSLKKNLHVNLLLVQDYYTDENEENKENNNENTPLPKFHYVWIKNLSRLVRSQITSTNRRCFICDRCLHFFNTEEKLNKHEVDCTQLNKCKIKLPIPQDNVLSFKNFKKQIKVPYIIYADFECLLKPVEDETLRVFQEHEAYSIGYYLKCSFDDRRSGYHSYRQEEADGMTPAEWFVRKLLELADHLNKLYNAPQPMNFGDQENGNFNEAKSCHICGKMFLPTDKKVRDHCHITGMYRGAAHEGCNINYKDARFIPVVFHNLTGYDSHFIIKELASDTVFKGRVQLIAENKERYISFSKYIEGTDFNFRFIDSFRFMASSLEKLASYMDEKKITSTVFAKDGYADEQIKLLLRKGVFPYDYVSSLGKLEKRELPSKEDFYSKLTESGIADTEYDHAKNVWNTFNIHTLGEYSDLYLKTDVLLLADVFENFRTTCIEAYGLDPAHYYTTPGLTWDAMLKCTGVELQLLTDIDMLMFIERGIRGGVSQCSNRYAKANNKFMTEGYNPNEEEKYLMYYDANNLYGWAMTQYLPEGGFRWVEYVNEPGFFNIPDDNPFGYILEVDLEYPTKLHDDHKDLPLCPEHMAPPGSRQKKLLTTLFNKSRYIIHYRVLKQALEHGLVLKKVHRALRFKQSPWLKPYVELNTEKRKQAKNEFEKLFFKLLINAVYGKTMENERKRVDVKLVNKWTGRYGAEALIAKPNFHSRSIFSENLVAIQLARTEITIRKPIYVGLSVLDISKTLIYDFHYSYMRKKIGDKSKLLYTDTDSLIYEVRGINMYEVMKEDIEKFDTSDYPENNQFGLPRKNKKVVGLMKDECNGNIMTEFIGLRSKMYSIRIQNDKPIKKAKGVKSTVVKTSISFENYRDCLFNESTITCQQNNIRSKNHVVRTEKEKKIALSPHDDKRHLLLNSTDTLPWGHTDIFNVEDEKLLENLLYLGDEGMEVEEQITSESDGEGGAVTGLHKEREQRVRHSPSLDEPENGEPPSKRLRL